MCRTTSQHSNYAFKVDVDPNSTTEMKGTFFPFPVSNHLRIYKHNCGRRRLTPLWDRETMNYNYLRLL